MKVISAGNMKNFARNILLVF